MPILPLLVALLATASVHAGLISGAREPRKADCEFPLLRSSGALINWLRDSPLCVARTTTGRITSSLALSIVGNLIY